MTTGLGFVGYLAVIAAAAYWLDRSTGSQVDPLLRPWAAVAAATLSALGLSNVVQLLRGYGQGDGSRSAVLARAATGEPPVDGGLMVVTGVARPESGQPLSAPLTGLACVAYDYRLYRRTWGNGRRRQTTVFWWGAATQPFVVETGARAVRVLALPEILDGARPVSRTAEVLARCRAYVQRTTFDAVTELGMIGAGVDLMGARKAAHPSGVRYDWRRGGTEPDVAALLLDEGIVPVGETVSVLGHWSPQHGAIIPAPDGLNGSPVAATKGAATQLSSTTLPHSALAVTITAILLLAAGLGLGWAMQAGYVQLAQLAAYFRV